MDIKKYETSPYHFGHPEFLRQNAELLRQNAELHEQFREEALKEVGLWGHPRADQAYEMAWVYGHRYGLQEVFFMLSDLASLFDERTV